ncbi:MAG: hypothetical protein BWY81_00387 [Firmicutes bacterium ADurb.Bin467]|nr:MAG: hypothetical protein BWY81_00387 [Firmicutes bacterium ADurb.Bin467]
MWPEFCDSVCAIGIEFVTTLRFESADSSCATNSVVVPELMNSVSPSRRCVTAARAIRRFSSALSWLRSESDML